MANHPIFNHEKIQLICGALSESKSLESFDKWKEFCKQLLKLPYFAPGNALPFQDDATFCALKEILEKWILLNGREATAKNFIKCLDAIELFEEADEVRQIFCPADHEEYDLIPSYNLKDVNEQIEPNLFTNSVFKFVDTNINSLVRHTRLSTKVIQFLRKKSMFSDEDIKKLESVDDSDDEDEQPESSYLFYKMLQKSPQNLNKYITALKEDKQWSAMWILLRLYHSIVRDIPPVPRSSELVHSYRTIQSVRIQLHSKNPISASKVPPSQLCKARTSNSLFPSVSVA